MMQAALQEEDTDRKAKLYAAHPAKISPFQRGKQVFVKATRAIKDRLSNHSDEAPAKPAAPLPKNIYLNYGSEVSSI